MAVSPNGNCVVSDTADHSVSVYRGEHTCVARFGSKGSRDDQFDNPLYVATGLNNEIAVSDSNNHCIKVDSSLLHRSHMFNVDDDHVILCISR